ncbi:hypothetical protein ACFLZW_02470 [Chloroflexota bacterium]
MTQKSLDFSAYISERGKHFTGREWIFQEIDAWLSDEEGERVFLLTGDPGSGKTSIAARLVQFSTGQTPEIPAECKSIQPDFISAFHFCSAREQTWHNPHAFIESLALQLAARFPEYAEALAEQSSDEKTGDKKIDIDVRQRAETISEGGKQIGVYIENLNISSQISAEDAFLQVIRQPLEAVVAPVVILVDALDESLVYTGKIGILHLLARAKGLPGNVRLLLTSRREDVVESQFLEAEGLFLSAKKYEDHNNGDVRRYIEGQRDTEPALAEQLCSHTTEQQQALIETLTHKAAGNFRYVSFLLAEVIAGKRELDNLEGLPEGLDGLYYDSLERLVGPVADQWVELYAPLMGVLSVAQTGLGQDQIGKFISADQNRSPDDDSIWTALAVDLDQFVRESEPESPDEADTYQLYHQSVSDFLAQKHIIIKKKASKKRIPNRFYLPPVKWHQRIVAYYWQFSPAGWTGCDQYGLNNLATHLVEADDRGRLPELISKTWMETRYERSGFRYGGYLDDIEKALRLVQTEDDPDLDALVRLHTARQVVFFRLRSTLTSSIAKLLVKTDRFDEALARARLLPNPRRRCEAILNIAVAGRMMPDGMPALLEEVGEIVDTIPDLKGRIEVLAFCAAIAVKAELPISTGMFERALHTAHEMKDLKDKSDGLAKIAHRMLEFRQAGVESVVKELIACIRRMEDEHNFPRFGEYTKHAIALRRIDPEAAKPLVDAAMAETPKYSDGFPHDQAAADLVRLLVMDGRLGEAERWTRTVSYPRFIVSTLTALVSRLDGFPDDKRQQLVSELVDAVRVLIEHNAGGGRNSLSDIGPVEAAARTLVEQNLYDLAGQFVRSAPSEIWKAQILRSMAAALYRMDDKMAGRVFEEAVKTILDAGISSLTTHRRIMHSLLSAECFDLAEALMEGCEDQRLKDDHLSQIVESLVKKGALEEAETLANKIVNPAMRMNALTKVALGLVDNERVRNLADGIILQAETKVDEAARLEALAGLGRIIAEVDASRGHAFLRELYNEIQARGGGRTGLQVIRALSEVGSAMARQGLMTESKAIFGLAEESARKSSIASSELHSIAKRMAEAGLLDEAERIGKTLPSRSPEAAFTRIKLYAENGEFDRAELIVEGIRNKGWRYEGAVRLVRYLGDAGHVQRAESIAQTIEYDSKRANAFTALGISQHNRDQDRAREFFLRAIELLEQRSNDWDRALALVDMIGVLDNVGMYELAARTPERIQNEEARNRGYRELAIAFTKRGDLLQAERVIEHNIEKDLPGGGREKVRCYATLSTIAMAQNPEFARQCLQSAHRWASKQKKWAHDEALIIVAEAFVRCGFSEQGLALLQDISYERKRQDASSQLADLLAETGAFADALPLLWDRKSLDEYVGVLVKWAEFVREDAPGKKLSFITKACQVVGWIRHDWARIANLLADILSKR